MSDRLLTDEEIARALEKRKIFKGEDLSGAIDEGDRFIAKAQDKKTASIVRQEMVEEIKGEIEKRFLGSLSATSRGIVQPQFFRYEWEEYWQELKRKWGVSDGKSKAN